MTVVSPPIEPARPAARWKNGESARYRRASAQPFEKAQIAEGKDLVFASIGFDSASLAL